MRLSAITLRRWGCWLAGLWGGVLLCIALMAAPAAFAILVPDMAGRLVARLFAQEAYLSLALSILLFLVARGQARSDAEAGKSSLFSIDMLLILGSLFCTVAGYFALQPMLAAARAGQGAASFAMLHGIAMGFYAIKALMVLALAWRLSIR
jgi:hypothetical protein